MAAWKTKRAGQCCVTYYHDTRSAITSTFVDELVNTVDEIYTEADKALMKWRYSMSTITIETEIGRQVDIINSGFLIGDMACPKDFVHTFAKCIKDGLSLGTEPDRMALYTRPPVTDQVAGLSTSTVAVAKKHTGATTEEAIARPAGVRAPLAQPGCAQ